MATNFGKLNFSTSFNPTSAFPLDARCYFESFADAQAAALLAEEAGSSNTVYYYGETFVVTESGKSKLYIVQPDKTLKEAGAGSLVAANYSAALALASADNKGTIIYVENEEVVKDVTYSAGPYIVTGAGTVDKLGTTSASGNIAGDVATLKGKVADLEGKVGDETSGLVKGLADANVEIAKKYEKPADGIPEADLAQTVKDKLAKAVSAIQKVITGTANGTISVDGKDVAVKGLGSAAYTEASAYATAAQGAKADTAVQSVDTGENNGTIKVDGVEVAVKGLGDAAYTTVNALNTTAKGYADTALQSAKTFTNEQIALLKKANMVVVAAKPETGEAGVIYLVGAEAPYEMWIYEGEEGAEKWISLGTTEVDLSHYYTKEQVDTELKKKANQADFETLSGTVGEHTTKITALEGKAHTHANKATLDAITTEVKAGYDAAVTDVSTLKTTVGDATSGIVKDVADLKAADTAFGGRINTLESKAHSHDNKTVLDAITAEVKAGYDAAVTKLAGIEENAQVNVIESIKVNGVALDVTDKAVDVNVPTTEGIDSQIKAITDPINTKVSSLDTTINDASKGLVKKVGDLTTAISTKVESSVVEALDTRVGVNETAISGLRTDVDALPTVAAVDAQIKAITDPLGKRVTALETYKEALEPRVVALETHAVLDTDVVTLNGGNAATK